MSQQTAPYLVDDPPVSGRSQPRPVPVTGTCRMWWETKALTGQLHAWCENHTPWESWTFDPPLHDGQIAELMRQHAGTPQTLPLAIQCEARTGTTQCQLPQGHYRHHHALVGAHSVTWPSEEENQS